MEARDVAPAELASDPFATMGTLPKVKSVKAKGDKPKRKKKTPTVPARKNPLGGYSRSRLTNQKPVLQNNVSPEEAVKIVENYVHWLVSDPDAVIVQLLLNSPADGPFSFSLAVFVDNQFSCGKDGVDLAQLGQQVIDDLEAKYGNSPHKVQVPNGATGGSQDGGNDDEDSGDDGKDDE